MTEKMIGTRVHSIRKRVCTFCLILIVAALVSCGGGGGEGGGAIAIGDSSSKNITSFSILGINGTISGTTITLTVPNGTDVKALVATFTSSGVSVKVGAVEQQSGVTANNFTNTVTYTVTAEDDSTKDYTVTVSVGAAPTGGFVANHLAAASFDSIPDAYITAAKNNLHIAYGHTSHGSQIITGMNALKNHVPYGTKYNWNNGALAGALDIRDGAMGGDVGYYPDWVNNTRSYLGAVNGNGRGSNHPEINVIIWSWCGQAAGKTQQSMIDEYLAPMAQLETEYWDVKFVYMTGHLDGSGTAGNLHQRNEQIRNYCSTNNKYLFDFADIESYNPSGSEFLSLGANDNCDYNSGNWATQWITANPGSTLTTLANNCGSCAHSQELNCVLKGRAAWWLWARLAGWNP